MLGKYNRRTVAESTGAVIPGATVRFFNQATGLPANAYSDPNGTTSLGSVITSGPAGEVEVFLFPGRYRITVTFAGNLVEEITYEPVVGDLAVVDPSDLGRYLSVASGTGLIRAESSGLVSFIPVTYTGPGTVNLDNIPSGLTADRALVSNSAGAITVSAVTSTQLGYLSGVTSPIQTQLNARELTANKGAVNGYAPLDSTGRVPAANLPAYVDDVVEYPSASAFPTTGTAGMLYVALDTNRIYRWSGTAYVEISPSPGSTDSVPEGSVNLYFTNARAVAAVQSQLDAKANSSVSITAGTGLTGGGNLTTSRTLSVVYGTTAGTSAQGNDSRLSDSREWTASTVSQAEAEAGTATDRRAWTAQRVRQAIVAWWNATSTTVGRALATLANPSAVRFIRINADNTVTARTAAEMRTDLGLGTAATANTGEFLLKAGDTATGNVIVSNSAYRYIGVTRGAFTTEIGMSGNVPRTEITAKNSGGTDGRAIGITAGTAAPEYFDGTTWRTIYHSANLLNIGTTAASARTALGLGTAATANTGPGNGLDADTVDGVHASSLAQLSANQTFTGSVSFGQAVTINITGATSLVSVSSMQTNGIFLGTSGNGGGAAGSVAVVATADGSTPRPAVTTLRVGATTGERDLWVSSGNAYIEGEVHCTDLVTTSARRFKTDIATLRPDGEAFDMLRPVSYREIDTGKPSLGLIAEELMEIYPELVAMDPDGQCRGVNYPKIVALLIVELQDVRRRVAELEGAR